MTHLTEEELILLYYNEPGVSRAHLNKCSDCQAAARQLAATLNACNEWPAPETAPDYGRSVWAQLAPQLTAGPKPANWFAPFLRPQAWVAVAVLVIAAFIAGRSTSQRPVRPITAGLSRQARQRILAISLADHLDRTEVLLTEISNSGDAVSDRARAEDLLNESRLMRQSLEKSGDRGTAALLEEVERILLEVANAPERVGKADLEGLRQRIGSDSLLFKVRVVESNLRTQGQKL